MATQTTNYGFKKPDGSDFYNIQDQNNNWDIADEKIKEAKDVAEARLDATADPVVIGFEASANDASVAVGRKSNAQSQLDVAIGFNAHTYGSAAVAIGNDATTNETGTVAIGNHTNAAGAWGIAIGERSKAYQEAQRGIAIGYYAQSGGFENPNTGILESAYDSIAIGSNATACMNNSIAIGTTAKTVNSSAISIGSLSKANDSYSISIGYYSNSSGYAGIAIGRSTVANVCCTAIGDGAKATGDYSTAIGACTNAVSDSIAIGTGATGGAFAGCSVTIGKAAKIAEGCNYSMALGFNARATTANTIQMGDSGVTAFKCKVQVTTTSDERDKADIENIEKATEFLRAIRTITYVRNDRDAYAYPEEKLTEVEKENASKYGFWKYNKREHKKGTLKGERRRAGVIAQEVRQAMLDVYGDDSYANLVDDNLYNYEDVPEGVESHLGVTYANFVPFLIKAVQELDARVQDLEAKLAERDSAGK